MRKSHVMLVAMAIILSAPAAWAQRPQGGGGFGGGGFNLLGQESVQQDLKLSADQIKKVDEFLAKQRETFSGLGDLSREERQTKFAELAKANQATIDSMLDEGQRKRLKQITLQQRGAQALSDPEVASTVGLADDQKTKIRELADKYREEMRGAFQGGGGGGGDREAMRKKLDEARTAINEKIQAILTPEQQTKWKEMVGEPFKGELRFRRGGGGGGGGGNRRRARDNSATQVTPSDAGAVRFVSFANEEPADTKTADRDDDKDDDKADKDDRKPGDRRDARPRGPRDGQRGPGARGRGPRSFGPIAFDRPMNDRDRAWSRVESAVGHHGPRPPFGPGARGPNMHWRTGGPGQFAGGPHRGPSPGVRGFHGGPPHFQFAGRSHHRGPEHMAHDGHHRHGHHGHFAHHLGPQGRGHHGRMAHHRGPGGHHGHFAHHRGPQAHGHHGHGQHGDFAHHGRSHHGPPHSMMAEHHRGGPTRSFSFAPQHAPGHHGHHGHMHMAGFKRQKPHGHSSQGKHGDHHRGDAHGRKGPDEKHRDDDRKRDRDDD